MWNPSPSPDPLPTPCHHQPAGGAWSGNLNSPGRDQLGKADYKHRILMPSMVKFWRMQAGKGGLKRWIMLCHT